MSDALYVRELWPMKAKSHFHSASSPFFLTDSHLPGPLSLKEMDLTLTYLCSENINLETPG
jgi:hypothetical protein